MRLPHLLAAALVAGALGVTPGCAYHRTLVNAPVLEMDTTGIVPGETTWAETLRALGPPSAPDANELTTTGIRPDRLDYVCTEVKRVEFRFLPLYIFGWGHWSDSQPLRHIMIEMDDQGVVTDIVESRRRAVWPTFGRENDQPLTITHRDRSSAR